MSKKFEIFQTSSTSEIVLQGNSCWDIVSNINGWRSGSIIQKIDITLPINLQIVILLLQCYLSLLPSFPYVFFIYLKQI